MYAKPNSMLLASKKSFYPEQGFLIWKKNIKICISDTADSC